MRPISGLLPGLLPALLALSASACASSDPTTSWVELSGHRYKVEIADDFSERQRGLMFRDEMAKDHGMLFIHEEQQPLAYWMKNTRIPLDILYFDNGHKLVAQQRDVPPCTAGDRCPAYPSQSADGSIVPARFVLELNAGEAAQLGLKTGEELRFGPGIQDAP